MEPQNAPDTAEQAPPSTLADAPSTTLVTQNNSQDLLLDQVLTANARVHSLGKHFAERLIREPRLARVCAVRAMACMRLASASRGHATRPARILTDRERPAVGPGYLCVEI